MNDAKLHNPVGIKGAYAYQVVDDNTGDVLVDIPEQCNLILDGWLSESRPIPTSLWLCIGAGVVTPPAVSDTSLGNQVKALSASFSAASGQHSATVDSVTLKYSTVRDFTGFSGESVSEIGLRISSSSGKLITRALIKNQSGNPTSIQVNEGQTLRITYSIYIRLKLEEDIAGELPTPHGPLKYVYKWPVPPLSLTSTQLESMANNVLGCPDWLLFLPGTNRPLFLFGSIPSAYNPSINTTERTVSFTISFPATSSNRTIASNTEFPRRTNNANQNPNLPTFVLTDPYILPANYDFSTGLVVTWGRIE